MIKYTTLVEVDGEITAAEISSDEFHKLESLTHGRHRRVALDSGLSKHNLRVSTVLLPGVWEDDLLFETMVFPAGSSADLYCDRYVTYAEALAGHNDVVQKLQNNDEDFLQKMYQRNELLVDNGKE